MRRLAITPRTNNARPLAGRCAGRAGVARKPRSTKSRPLGTGSSKKPSRCELRREGRPAAAGVLRVRVLEREPALPELAFDVVDFDAEEVHRAHRIDEAPHALHLEDHVAGAFVLLEIEAVLETGAAASHYGDTQPGSLQVLALDRFLHHRGGLVGEAHRRRGLGGGGLLDFGGDSLGLHVVLSAGKKGTDRSLTIASPGRPRNERQAAVRSAIF